MGSKLVEENRWQLKKAAGLVKLLALAPHHTMHRERVTNLLWPDLRAEAATNNLHRTLSFVRHTLVPQALATASRYLRLAGEQLALCPEGSLWVDLEAFEEAAAMARRARDPPTYRAAVEPIGRPTLSIAGTGCWRPRAATLALCVILCH